MRINLLLPAAILLAITFQACNKVSESFQRDVIIAPDSILSDIPIIPVINKVVMSADLPIILDLAKEIREKASDFDVQDIRNFKIVSLRLDLLDTLIPQNNYGNIFEAKLLITTGTKVDTLARVSNTSNGPSQTLSLTPLISGDALKNLMSNSAAKYNLQYRARTETKVVLKSKVTAVYTLTLSK